VSDWSQVAVDRAIKYMADCNLQVGVHPQCFVGFALGADGYDGYPVRVYQADNMADDHRLRTFSVELMEHAAMITHVGMLPPALVVPTKVGTPIGMSPTTEHAMADTMSMATPLCEHFSSFMLGGLIPRASTDTVPVYYAKVWFPRRGEGILDTYKDLFRLEN